MAKRHVARNTLIAGVLELAEQFGIERDEILAEIGLDPALVRGVGTLIPSEAIIDAVELSAERSGRDDFGLLLGGRQDHRLMGPLGLLFEQASTITELQAFSKRFFHLHNTALVYTLRRKGHRGVMQLVIKARGAREPKHYVECLFVIVVRMAQIILGPKWRPVGVHFRHSRLANRAAYERHFGRGVHFNQDMDAIICTAGDMDRSVEPRNPEIKYKLEAMLQQLDTQYANDVVAKVSHIIRAFLPGGQASIEQVSKLMSMTPRTLQRRLRAAGVTFSDVLTNTRIELAREYLRGGGLNVTQIAPILGFSEASAVSRFLRQSGLSAQQLRTPLRRPRNTPVQ